LKRNRDELEKQLTASEKIVELLRHLPARDAQDVLGRIRFGTDIEDILNHIENGNLLLQMHVVPETRFRYDFPYRSEMPEDHLQDNPYLDSLIYKAASLFPKDRQHSNPSAPSSATIPPDLRSIDLQSPYLKPFHAAQIIEPLLFDAKVSAWTTVCDDDVLMRELLAVFFRCEYHFTAAFQKDIFLEDMAARREDFCSSLLVNVTLAYACVWCL
jgi:hypothetical protein